MRKKSTTINVNLRKTKIKQGAMYSFYLDFFPPITNPTTGKETRREFLGLHTFVTPTNKAEKSHNKETEAKAGAMLLERTKQVNEKDTSFLEKEKKETPLLFFAQNLVQKYEGSTKAIWSVAIQYLENFLKGAKKENITFAKLTLQLCKDYREFLSTVEGLLGGENTLSKNSRALYFTKFKTCLKNAFDNEFLELDFSHSLKPLPTTETKREYLTLQELQTLAKTPCKKEYLKNASLFSALTGLRFSDIAKMTWGEIRETKEGIELHYTQKKTGAVQVHPIGKQAYDLLGERKNDSDIVFPRLKNNNLHNTILELWLTKAGITKDITFHCFRHTFATLQLEAGTDIYTVSKLLGHTDITTTQIYAKIVDKTKRDAVNKISLEL